ncbi:MAG: hypothetical protein KGD64_13455 [Candidatus Heimdallarchaeota archaeon]|nr:hypothetical protein [Candidatus Heimdallarchaeota archaeon]
MEDESDNLRFILEKILEIEDSSKKAVFVINAIEKPVWKTQDIDDTIRFQSKNYKQKGSEINSKDFRKIYSGISRRKLPVLPLQNKNDQVAGAFLFKLISRIWKLSIRETVEDIKLIPYEDDPYRARYLQISFPSGIFIIRSIFQLFPTDDYYEINMEYSKKYAKAYKKFKELKPFIVDRIIDLLSTDEIAPSFEAWVKDPQRYDLPNVDTANITLAKKLAEDLPAEELNVLVDQIREVMTESDWESHTDKQTLERYSIYLKYIKKIRKEKKKELPQD